MATRGSNIRIFLVDGTPEGLKIATKSNWTGQAIMAARADYPELRKRAHWLSSPGVYILVGPPDQGTKPRIYVGETDNLVQRLDQHSKTKDFWSSVVVCNASNDSLDKALIRYLEFRLIQLASHSGQAVLDNSSLGSPVKLSEADTEDAETYLDELMVLLPVLGIGFFDPVEHAESESDDDEGTEDGSELFLAGPNSRGTGYDRSDGFLVRKGSTARKKVTPSIGIGVLQLREELLADGTFSSDAAHLTLTKSYRFNSPSQAAAVLLGRTANGRTEWRDKSGRTLSEIQALVIASQPPVAADGVANEEGEG